MKNNYQVSTTALKNIRFDRSYQPYNLTSTAVDLYSQPCNCMSTKVGHSAHSHDCTSRKRRQKRRNVKVFTFQFITIALCIAFLVTAFITFYDSLCLLSIGNEVAEMGIVKKGDSNYPRYRELQSKRNDIENSSWIGYLLVIAGGNDFWAAIRNITIGLVALAAIPVIIYIRYIVIIDIEYFKKL